VAEERGLGATFMPKPFTDLTGNGAHMHIRCGLLKRATMLFLDKTIRNALSSLALCLHGWCWDARKGLCALTAPSVIL
jgi:glutamine synthetase